MIFCLKNTTEKIEINFLWKTKKFRNLMKEFFQVIENIL